jgi:hypothetical protein
MVDAVSEKSSEDDAGGNQRLMKMIGECSMVV